MEALRVLICDDEPPMVDRLASFSRRLAAELGAALDLATFTDGAALIEGYGPGADVALIDIEMPLLNGIDAAGELRRLDANVCIVFVTAFEQYAISGYRVGAYRYLVKPVVYETFRTELAEAWSRALDAKQRYVSLKTDAGFIKLAVRDIECVETLRNHHLLVHGGPAGPVEVRGNISEFEASLGPGFFRCHRSYLVNLSHVRLVDGLDALTDDGTHVAVSKYRRRAFAEALTRTVECQALSSAGTVVHD